MKIIIYGCSYEAEKFMKVNKDNIDILYCIEDHLKINEFGGFPVYNSSKLKECPDAMILIFTRNVGIYQKISSVLKSYGLKEFDNYIPAHLYRKKIALIWGNCHAGYLKLFLSYSKEFSGEYAFYDTKNLWDMKEEDIDKNLFQHCDLLVCQQLREENSLGRSFSSAVVEKMLNKDCKILRFPNLFGLPKFMFPQTERQNIYSARGGMHRWYRDIYIDELMQTTGSPAELVDRLINKKIDTQQLDEALDTFWDKVQIREAQSNIHIIDYLKKHFTDMQLFLDLEHPSKFVLNEIGNRMLDFLHMRRLPADLQISNVYAHEVPVYPQVKEYFHMTWPDGDIKRDNQGEKMDVVYMDFPEYVRQYTIVYKRTNQFSYSAYMEDKECAEIGKWVEADPASGICGSTGKALKLFAIKINPLGHETSRLRYKVCSLMSGWSDWKRIGEVAGNIMDEGDYITAIVLDDEENSMSLQYQVHIQNKGWLPAVGLGEETQFNDAGLRVEAFKIMTKFSGGRQGGINNSDKDIEANRLDDLRKTAFRTWIEKYNKSPFISVGDFTYGVPEVRFNRNEMESVSIGKFCSIAAGVKIFGGGEHDSRWATTYPFCVFLKEFSNIDGYPAYRQRRTKIGNDVWIGEDARILNGVSVGDGAIIGTAAIVTKDVPPYAIVAGNPARVIRYRFESDVIEKLMEMQWWDWTDSQIYQAVLLLESEDIDGLYDYYLTNVGK